MGGTDFDVAILGAGLSGTLTAHAIGARRWARHHRVAVLDESPTPLATRAWGYWGPGPVLPGVDSGTWDELVVRDEWRTVNVPLTEQRYRRMSGDLLASFVERSGTWNTVERLTARVVRVTQESGGDREEAPSARIALDSGATVTARHVLDSTRALLAGPTAPALQFLGYRLPAGADLPDGTDRVTLMDLRVPQGDGATALDRGSAPGVRFVYVVPEPTGALVEMTAFLPRGGTSRTLDSALHAWISRHIGPGALEAAAPAEAGRYPLLRRGRRHISPSVLLIGLGAGGVRPATGYGVRVMADDARAIADCLERQGHPFVPRRHGADRHGWYTRTLDRVFLRAMADDPEPVRLSYPAMFSQAGGDAVLAFLNGAADVGQTVSLIGSMPRTPFLRAAVGVARRDRRG